MRNYTGYGWEGSKYDSDLTIVEVAKKVRKELKKLTGTKWSVTTKKFSMGCSMSVSLMEAPFPVFKEGVDKTYAQINNFHIDRADYITDNAKRILIDAKRLAGSFNYDDSDSQIDYFNTNFYFDLNVGKYDRPFKIVEVDEWSDPSNIWKVS